MERESRYNRMGVVQLFVDLDEDVGKKPDVFSENVCCLKQGPSLYRGDLPKFLC